MRVRLVLLAAALVVVVAPSSSGAPARPALRISDQQPLAVAGSAFHPRELVRVEAIGAFGTRATSVRATRMGRFVARFASLSADPCRLRFVKATGAHGSRAMLRLPPGACPALGPD